MNDMDREQYWTRPPRVVSEAEFGPSAQWAPIERQRALWAGEFNDTPAPSTTKEAANG